jgi:hypothetical protein
MVTTLSPNFEVFSAGTLWALASNKAQFKDDVKSTLGKFSTNNYSFTKSLGYTPVTRIFLSSKVSPGSDAKVSK